ncbi:uncharacterized protein [Littorina saxatilis]|uniref:uncharacterized protein n=1 Tax=Littorina saxatilis TaxID=31220 RepID=UPI0038B5F41F
MDSSVGPPTWHTSVYDFSTTATDYSRTPSKRYHEHEEGTTDFRSRPVKDRSQTRTHPYTPQDQAYDSATDPEDSFGTSHGRTVDNDMYSYSQDHQNLLEDSRNANVQRPGQSSVGGGGGGGGMMRAFSPPRTGEVFDHTVITRSVIKSSVSPCGDLSSQLDLRYSDDEDYDLEGDADLEEEVYRESRQPGSSWDKGGEMYGESRQPVNSWDKGGDMHRESRQPVNSWDKGGEMYGESRQPVNSWDKGGDMHRESRQPGSSWDKGGEMYGESRQPGSSWDKGGGVLEASSSTADWKRPDMHMFKASSYKDSVTSEKSSRLDPHTYQSYAAGILYSSGRSEKFLKLQKHFAILERIGELDQISSPEVLHEHGSKWREMGGSGFPPAQDFQSKEELQELYSELREAKRNKEFFHEPDKPQEFQWTPHKDFGLQKKQLSFGDRLRNYAERVGEETGPSSQASSPVKEEPLRRAVSFGALYDKFGRPIIGHHDEDLPQSSQGKKGRTASRDERDTEASSNQHRPSRRDCQDHGPSESLYSSRAPGKEASRRRDSEGKETGFSLSGRPARESTRHQFENTDKSQKRTRFTDQDGQEITPAESVSNSTEMSGSSNPKELSYLQLMDNAAKKSRQRAIHGTHMDAPRNEYEVYVEEMKKMTREEVEASNLHIRSLSAPHSALKTPALATLPRSQSSKESFFGTEEPNDMFGKPGIVKKTRERFDADPEIVVDSAAKARSGLQVKFEGMKVERVDDTTQPPEPAASHSARRERDVSIPEPAASHSARRERDVSIPEPAASHSARRERVVSIPEPAASHSARRERVVSIPEPAASHSARRERVVSIPEPAASHSARRERVVSIPEPAASHSARRERDVSIPEPASKWMTRDSGQDEPQPTTAANVQNKNLQYSPGKDSSGITSERERKDCISGPNSTTSVQHRVIADSTDKHSPTETRTEKQKDSGSWLEKSAFTDARTRNVKDSDFVQERSGANNTYSPIGERRRNVEYSDSVKEKFGSNIPGSMPRADTGYSSRNYSPIEVRPRKVKDWDHVPETSGPNSTETVQHKGYSSHRYTPAEVGTRKTKDSTSVPEQPVPYTPAAIQKDTGHSPAIQKDRGCSPAIQKDTGHSPAIQKDTGHSPAIQKDTGHSPAIQKDTGHSPAIHKDTGHSPAIQKDTGHSPAIQKDTGHSPAIQKDSGYSPAIQKDSGYSPAIDKDSGYSPAIDKDSGDSPNQQNLRGGPRSREDSGLPRCNSNLWSSARSGISTDYDGNLGDSLDLAECELRHLKQKYSEMPDIVQVDRHHDWNKFNPPPEYPVTSDIVSNTATVYDYPQTQQPTFAEHHKFGRGNTEENFSSTKWNRKPPAESIDTLHHSDVTPAVPERKGAVFRVTNLRSLAANSEFSSDNLAWAKKAPAAGEHEFPPHRLGETLPITSQLGRAPNSQKSVPYSHANVGTFDNSQKSVPYSHANVGTFDNSQKSVPYSHANVGTFDNSQKSVPYSQANVGQFDKFRQERRDDSSVPKAVPTYRKAAVRDDDYENIPPTAQKIPPAVPPKKASALVFSPTQSQSGPSFSVRARGSGQRFGDHSVTQQPDTVSTDLLRISGVSHQPYGQDRRERGTQDRDVKRAEIVFVNAPSLNRGAPRSGYLQGAESGGAASAMSPEADSDQHKAEKNYGQLRKWTAVADIYRGVEKSWSPTREVRPFPPDTNNSSISSTDTFIVKETDEEDSAQDDMESSGTSVSQLRDIFERRQKVSKSRSEPSLSTDSSEEPHRPRSAKSQTDLNSLTDHDTAKPSVVPSTVSGDIADIRHRYDYQAPVVGRGIEPADDSPRGEAMKAWVQYEGRVRYDPYLPPEDILKEVSATATGRKLDVPRKRNHRPSHVSHMTLQYFDQIGSEWQQGGSGASVRHRTPTTSAGERYAVNTDSRVSRTVPAPGGIGAEDRRSLTHQYVNEQTAFTSTYPQTDDVKLQQSQRAGAARYTADLPPYRQPIATPSVQSAARFTTDPPPYSQPQRSPSFQSTSSSSQRSVVSRESRSSERPRPPDYGTQPQAPVRRPRSQPPETTGAGMKTVPAETPGTRPRSQPAAGRIQGKDSERTVTPTTYQNQSFRDTADVHTAPTDRARRNSQGNSSQQHSVRVVPPEPSRPPPVSPRPSLRQPRPQPRTQQHRHSKSSDSEHSSGGDYGGVYCVSTGSVWYGADVEEVFKHQTTDAQRQKPQTGVVDPERERRRRQEEEAYRKKRLEELYEEERQKKMERDKMDTEARRHHDYFMNAQRSPISPNRFDDSPNMGSPGIGSSPLSPAIGSSPLSPSQPGSLGTLERKDQLSVPPERRRGFQLQGKARALYNFNAQNPRELSFRKNDIIYLHRQVDKNWFEGERHGRLGIFPSNYVEVVTSIEAARAAAMQAEGQGRARYNFTAQSTVELSLRKGEFVVLLRHVDDNWYEGRIGNRQGIFPISYVEVTRQPSTPLITPAPSVITTPMTGTPEMLSPVGYDAAPTPPPQPSPSALAAHRSPSGPYGYRQQGPGGHFFPTDPGSGSGSGSAPLLAPAPSVSRQQINLSRTEPDFSNPRSPVSSARSPTKSPISPGARLGSPLQGKRASPGPTPSFGPAPSLSVDIHSKAKPYTNGQARPGKVADDDLAVTRYRAVYAYRPQNEDELELREGDEIFVMEKCDDGWYVGTSNRTGSFGTFPGNYVQKI